MQPFGSEQPATGSAGTSVFAYVPCAVRQAGQASSGTESRTALTLGLFSSSVKAVAVVEYSLRSAPHPGHTWIVSGDCVWHFAQICTVILLFFRLYYKNQFCIKLETRTEALKAHPTSFQDMKEHRCLASVHPIHEYR